MTTPVLPFPQPLHRHGAHFRPHAPWNHHSMLVRWLAFFVFALLLVLLLAKTAAGY